VSSDYYAYIAGEIAGSGGNPMFDRMTEGEIAAYFAGQDREPPDEPSGDYLEAEAERAQKRHRDKDHGGGKCDCPAAGPEYSEGAPF
jgi:hypothetical protein